MAKRFSKYGAVSHRFCASHHCPPSVRKRSRMFHRMLITKRRWIGRPPKHYIGLGQGPIFAGQAVLACTDGHVPVAGKRLAYGQREQSVHRCSAGGLFLSGGAVGRAERRHIRHLATEFSPYKQVTRAQVATFLHRAVGSPNPQSMARFADVSSSAYYANAVSWAAASGITTGTSASAFSPDKGCTRAEIATFLYRSKNVPRRRQNRNLRRNRHLK